MFDNALAAVADVAATAASSRSRGQGKALPWVDEVDGRRCLLGFMMGVICTSIVVTRSYRRGRGKAVQPRNREWATVIERTNGEGWCLPPYMIVPGAYHLASCHTEGGLPLNWAIKPTSNGWTEHETGLDWIKHFDKHTGSRAKGPHQNDCGRRA